jgi:hypothetical protein
MEEKKEKMITLDSVSLVLPLFALKRKEIEGEIRIIQAFDRILGKREVITFDWLKGVKGLKALVIDWDRERVKFQFSAKVLGKDYFDLISKNNIERVFDIINSLGVGIEFYVDEVLKHGEIVNCDFTANLKVKEPVERYIFDLYMEASKLSRNWFMKKYKSDSIVFEETKKTKPLRMVIYNKYKEMLKRKEVNLGIEKFRNVLRFEINAKRKKNVRDLALTESNKILDILNSKANPYLKVFEKLFRGQVEMLFEKDKFFSIMDKRMARKYFEYWGVIKRLGSLEIYKDYLINVLNYSKSNSDKIIRDLMKVSKMEPKTNRRMNELYELIKKIA